MRKPIIAANWKMHKTISQARSFLDEFSSLEGKNKEVETVICPPFPLLPLLGEKCGAQGILLGAQNMHWEKEGAYTGEVSPLLLQDLQVKYVLCGHSERRQIFGEKNEDIARKVEAAFAHDIVPLLCIGETLNQRKAGETLDLIKEQLLMSLAGREAAQVRSMVVAYEPVWAIGSGMAATPADAEQVASHIRELVKEKFSIEIANEIRILYGGSVNPDNIGGFIGSMEIDGALVGGASLKAESFAGIISAAAGGID